MSKLVETYAVLEMSESGDGKIVKGGYENATAVKKAANEIAKQDGNSGKIFVPIRMWAPVCFKEVRKFEFVEPKIDIPDVADDAKKPEGDGKKENATAEPKADKVTDTPVSNTKKEAPVSDTKQEAPVEDAKQEAPVEDTKQEAPVEDVKEEAPAEGSQSAPVTASDEESDKDAFGALFGDDDQAVDEEEEDKSLF